MRQRRLGTTGLYVSQLALGTMSWGRDTDEDDAAAQLRTFLDAGGTLVDTADVYVGGESEHIVGRLLANTVRRDEVIVATKAGSRRDDGRDRDASRRHLLNALDASLARLGTDHVDLWQLHQWDPRTPIEEGLASGQHVRMFRVEREPVPAVLQQEPHSVHQHAGTEGARLPGARRRDMRRRFLEDGIPADPKLVDEIRKIGAR